MINEKRNHHFVSQAEQRLNAIDSSVSKKNQRIYAFSITDRENYQISLETPTGTKIKETLSFDDLFTIDILDDRLRVNLEDFFSSYEQDVSILTQSLLLKLKSGNQDLKTEILNIFAMKLINSFRNPFCIEKTLNTIGNLANYSPSDEKLKDIYKKIDSGNQASIKEFANNFSVTEEQYRKWMKSLFMLLVPKDTQGINLVDMMIKEFFENTDQFINVYVHIYSGVEEGKHSLLSDRGFTLLTDLEAHLAYEFNLTCNAFISYIFTDIKKAGVNQLGEDVMKSILRMQSKKPSELKIHFCENNLEILSRYNKNVVYQSYENVYCKSKVVYGL
ncbi:hypothetical protein [Rheinheimera nanhaiensis]|uniref:DUF4238 domain-containing protein n=1 Tax=Rheinheimera nanhaiensis E407-8 TaxID=562729 RepID=I1DY29_9GAMM|nr:hypothetical protein [Rheinheimera nanhaiensis]GAB58957.1 hypothetical protein RNAN_1945 [Rheinheimera nanhaiensis E407-8]